MSFDRQPDIFVAVATGVLVFVGMFLAGVPIEVSAIIATGVLVLGLLFGRDIVEAVSSAPGF
jgi:hypothetical protein